MIKLGLATCVGSELAFSRLKWSRRTKKRASKENEGELTSAPSPLCFFARSALLALDNPRAWNRLEASVQSDTR